MPKPPTLRKTTPVRPPVTPPPAVPPNFADQASQQVSSILDPQTRSVIDRYNRQAGQTAAGIGALTNRYAANLGTYAGQVPGMFEPAQQTVRGVSEGVNAQLTGLGQAAAGTEAGAMTGARLPTGAAGPDLPLAAEGAGAGQAAGAIGQNAINALQSAQKAAMTYAGQLPAFAKLEGDYQTRSALSTLAAAMADQLAQTTAEAPQMYWTIYQQLQDRAVSDKSFAEQVRQFDVGRADVKAANARTETQRRAGIVAPNAPTVAGRVTYYQSLAAQRSQQEGIVYKATSSGIRPVIDPVTGKPKKTLQGRAADVVAPPKQPTNTGPYYKNPTSGAWELRPGYQPGPNGTVVKTPAKGAGPKQPTNTGPYFHNPKTGKWELKPGYEIKNGKVVAVTPPKGGYGTAPRRVGPGNWVTRKGVPLRKKAAAIWEKKFQGGFTDGKGHLTPGKPKKQGGYGGGGNFDPATGNYGP
jgi:hypothetical protein